MDEREEVDQMSRNIPVPNSHQVKLDGPKLLVALLFADDSTGRKEIRGLTRMEKLLFLIQEESLRRQLYNYIAYDYGPWSEEIHDDLETLALRGVVEIRKESTRLPVEVADTQECLSNEDLDDSQVETTVVDTYSLTKQGEKAGQFIWNNISRADREAILDVKKKFNRESLLDLIRYVYEKHPDFASKSRIRNRIGYLQTAYASRPSLASLERDEQ